MRPRILAASASSLKVFPGCRLHVTRPNVSGDGLSRKWTRPDLRASQSSCTSRSLLRTPSTAHRFSSTVRHCLRTSEHGGLDELTCMRWCVVVALMLVMAGRLAAQDPSATVRIEVRHDGMPVEGASVLVNGTPYSTNTVGCRAGDGCPGYRRGRRGQGGVCSRDDLAVGRRRSATGRDRGPAAGASGRDHRLRHANRITHRRPADAGRGAWSAKRSKRRC